MSVNKKTQGKNAVERREIVESNTVELQTVLSAARDRRGRPRAQDGTRPLRDISEIPEGLRPFARYLSGRNARETSMAAYRKKAIAAQSYLIEAGMDQALGGLALNAFPWHFITPSVAFEYTQLLSRRYANVKTRENLLSVVRRIVRECATAELISYADREQLLDALPLHGAPVKRSGRELEDTEIRRLLAARASKSERLNLRNAAIVAVFLSTGLRVSEVSELDVTDVVFDERGAAVKVRRTKSGKAHFAWLNSTAAQYVKDWLAVRGNEDGALFDSANNPLKHLKASSLAEVIAKQARAAGLTKRFGSHDFRRTFATRALRAGADPFTVQKLLGHKNVTTTLVYDYRNELETRAVVEMLVIPTSKPRAPERRR